MLQRHSVPKLAAFASALLLIFSLLPIWPAGYYILMRYVAGLTAVLLVVRADEVKAQAWIVVWIAVAILFNPIMPLRLPTILSQGLSLTCGVLFLASIRRFSLCFIKEASFFNKEHPIQSMNKLKNNGY